MLDAAVRLVDFLWASFLVLAPMLLLGLFVAGLIHVLISREAILAWLSGDSLKSVCMSAAVGVPVPLCSCSVVPVVAEMRKKGASRSSCMSFLITAPETGADSILVTHAFFGFVAAVVRPLVSFATAVVAGVFCIGLIRDGRDEEVPAGATQHTHDHAHDHGHDCHDHSGHEPLLEAADDCYVGPSNLWRMFLSWLRSAPGGIAGSVGRSNVLSGVKADSRARPAIGKRSGAETSDSVVDSEVSDLSLGKVIRHIFRYGFVEVADDILFALLVGVALGGVLFLVIPDTLLSSAVARWVSYPLMVIVGIPIYICASASTPIAAALVAKGLSPGAALIFLMTGPATNMGTIAVIVSQFGARFASIYVGGVVAATVALGIAIDLTVLALGFALQVNLSAATSPAIQILEWAGAFALLGLIAWRFRHGALKSGYQELVSNLAPTLRRVK